MGNRDKDTGKRDGTMVQIMERGGLYFKAMQKSGDQDNEQLELLGGAVLGLGWSSERDMFVFQFAINVSPRKRKQPTGEDVTLEDLYKLEEAKLSKRICLSVVNSFYDPMGMLTPLTIILKFAETYFARRREEATYNFHYYTFERQEITLSLPSLELSRIDPNPFSYRPPAFARDKVVPQTATGWLA